MALGAVIGSLSGVASSIFSGPPKRVRKTDIGKFLQKVTTSGAPVQSSSQVPPTFVNANTGGVSGSVTFGQNQRLNYMPFAVIAGIVAVFYFIFGSKKKRR